MKKIYVKFQKLYDDVEIPEYQTPGSAGMDLKVKIRNNFGNLENMYSGEIKVFSTGLKIQIPEGYEGQIRSRSGLAVKGLCVVNSPGTIDSDYRGEIKIALANHNFNDQLIKDGDRVAQLIIKKVPQIKIEVVDELDDTDRNSGGFGSTGVK